MIFWCRRCSVQSRSNRLTAPPCRSANTCTSTWRGRSISRSSSTLSSPNDALASRRQAASASRKSAGPLDLAHPLAAAAGGGLDQHREADPLGLGQQMRVGLVGAVIARHQRHAGGLQAAPWRCPCRPAAPWPRPAARRRSGRRRGRRARRRRSRTGSRSPDAPPRPRSAGPPPAAVDDEIALGRGRRPQPHGLVGQPDMARVAIGVGIDRHRADAQPPAGLDDPAGDLAAIGDQQAVEQGPSPRSRRACASPGTPRYLPCPRPRRAARR